MPTDLTWIQLATLVLAGFAAGFVNVVAGGGSLLTLPALLFAGLPAPVANASNRIGLILQNVAATSTFHRGGRLPAATTAKLVLPALPGALLGAHLAVDVDEALFRRILAVVMIAVVVLILRGPRPGEKERNEAGGSRRWALYPSFFLMGAYAGFLQAGLGFLLVAALTGLAGLDLIRSNAVKVSLVLVLQLAALAVFQASARVDWAAGLTLALGSMTGGWMGARWQMRRGVVWVRRLLVVAVVLFAARLLQQSF